MQKIGIFLFSILLGVQVNAQSFSSANFEAEFQMAYVAYPEIPKGILEGVAYAQTRITHLTGNHEGCIGLPQVSGVMGLTEDGQGYFTSNLLYVSELSGITVTEIKNNPQKNILAYASAYSQVLSQVPDTIPVWKRHEKVLRTLSELPNLKNAASQYALDCFTYEVFNFLLNPEFQNLYHFPQYEFSLETLYGSENFKVLSSSHVFISEDGIEDEDGNSFTPTFKSLEYPPAIWVAAPSCNYSSRSGTPVSAVTIHTIQGSYAGAISWAQNCSSNVSYHYVARSSDGQITQMVYEADKGWHVGSENPYTIGIEHEGYVTNPAWYTEAMYQSSADLVRDICNSGYGINPLRTFQGPATSGSNVLGSCTKIKGHQHYPSQTHTDPGINWNWEYYYQLINDDPTIITYTANSGTFYDSGGAGGNYSNDERKLYRIQPAGAVTVSISFSSFNLENNWDYLYVYDGSTTSSPLMGVFTGTSLPSNLTSTGSSILIEFRSDCATVASGWQINWTTAAGPVVGDIIPPSTSVSSPSVWKVADFTATFSDQDNPGGSGILHQTYQVIDYDGVDWRANADHGFFSDNFDVSIHPEWTSVSGNWSIVSSVLQQNDEVNSNTNIYANLNQNDHAVFLYHWAGKISGSGTNKRAGFHFMCDNPTLTNRGNSYFVWFREDDNKVQIYKVVSDVFTLTADVPFDFIANQWYDFKTTFDKNSGAITVWVNDDLIASWVDSSPYTSGNSVSFRSGESVYDVNNFKVYHDRGISELVEVGVAGDLRFQNINPSTAAGKVKSIVIDSSGNVSSIAEQLMHVDWTNPSTIALIQDGVSADIDVTTSNTELSANWTPSSDPNSAIARYWYAIGTTVGGTDVVNWTDNWYDTLVTHTGLSLSYGETYYFSVRAENGAGLLSDVVSSDGQLLDFPVNPPVASFTILNTTVCLGDSLQFLNTSQDASTYFWSVPGAIPASSSVSNPYFKFPVSGTYDISLTATGPGGVDVLVETVSVETQNPPVAAYSQSAMVVPISYPFVTFTNTSSHANGYYWNFGDGSGSADLNPWHEFTSVGVYNVYLIAVNGVCPNDTTSSTVEVIETMDIDETNNHVTKIYPSPATDRLWIELDEMYTDQPIRIYLRDQLGRIIYQESSPSSGIIIEINLVDLDLSGGVYLIEIQQGEQAYMQKILIE